MVFDLNWVNPAIKEESQGHSIIWAGSIQVIMEKEIVNLYLTDNQ